MRDWSVPINVLIGGYFYPFIIEADTNKDHATNAKCQWLLLYSVMHAM